MTCRRPAPALVLAAVIAGCGRHERSAADFAETPDEARAVLARCGAAHSPRCDAARAGLAEAERRERMARYEAAF
ncbi:hypothetical protein [Brevundimonas naejangsanensis]|uniref:hypothetical protein n=1 Tax=Brevundimonas naejangsanensis TaxID=588932 RepID=UPI003207E186